MRGSDDVDDGLRIRGILGRRVGDGLDTLQRIGGQRLQIGLEVLLRQFGGFVVDPNLHTRNAAQGDVALHIDLHARRVLQRVFGSAGLDGGVLADVIDQLLTVHRIDGLLRLDGHLLQCGGDGHHSDGAEIGVVLYSKGNVARIVVEKPYTENAVALRHSINLKIAVRVGRRALDEHRVGGVQHRHVGIRQRSAGNRVAQQAHHLEGGSLPDNLLLSLLGILSPAAAVTHRRWSSRGRPARSSAGESSPGGLGHTHRHRHHQHCQNQHNLVTTYISYFIHHYLF